MHYKSISLLALFILVSVCLSSSCYAMTQNTTDTVQLLEKQMKVLNFDAIHEIENELKQNNAYLEGFDFETELRQMIFGEKRFSLESLAQLIGELFLLEFKSYGKIAIRFVLIVLLNSMLKALSASFESKNTSKVAFFVCYLVILYSVLESFVLLTKLAEQVVGHLMGIMAVSLPTLLAFMTSSGYVTSAAALMPLIISALNIVAFILQKMVMPLIVGIVVLQIISHMNEDIKVDKVVELFYTVTKYILRGILFISTGIMGIYRVILPTIDIGVKKSTLQFSSAFIPVVGDAASSVIQSVMLCIHHIKNSFAIAIIVWIVIVALMPLIKMLTYMFLYKIAAAVIEPIGDKKMVAIATDLAKGCEFIMSCTGVITLLAILAMIICISIGSSLL